MSAFSRDPLVGILKIVLLAVLAVLALAAICIVIAAVAVPFMPGEVAAELAQEGVVGRTGSLILRLEGLFLGILIMLVVIGFFLLDLWRILMSVAAGDPFVPINSVRLTRMAWLALAGQVWAVALGLYGAWMVAQLDGLTDADLDIGIDGGGILLILVLFVLARVFRHGTQLREDVEGVV